MQLSRRKWSPATTGPARPSMAFDCRRWSIYGCHRWSALPQVVPPFILLQMLNTGSLATCSLPSTIYMVEWMLHGFSKRLNGRQLEAIRLNERQFEANLRFYHMI